MVAVLAGTRGLERIPKLGPSLNLLPGKPFTGHAAPPPPPCAGAEVLVLGSWRVRRRASGLGPYCERLNFSPFVSPGGPRNGEEAQVQGQVLSLPCWAFL